MAQQPSEDEEDFGPLDKGVPQEYIGEDCPICGSELVKPRSEVPQCPHCRHVDDGKDNQELRDFELTFRQSKRLLKMFDYSTAGTPGDAETRLRQLCRDHEFEPRELNDFLRDMQGTGRYADDEDEDEEGELWVNTDPFCVLCGGKLEGPTSLDTGVCDNCADD